MIEYVALGDYHTAVGFLLASPPERSARYYRDALCTLALAHAAASLPEGGKVGGGGSTRDGSSGGGTRDSNGGGSRSGNGGRDGGGEAVAPTPPAASSLLWQAAKVGSALSNSFVTALLEHAAQLMHALLLHCCVAAGSSRQCSRPSPASRQKPWQPMRMAGGSGQRGERGRRSARRAAPLLFRCAKPWAARSVGQHSDSHLDAWPIHSISWVCAPLAARRDRYEARQSSITAWHRHQTSAEAPKRLHEGCACPVAPKPCHAPSAVLPRELM